MTYRPKLGRLALFSFIAISAACARSPTGDDHENHGAPSADFRMPVELTAAERDHVLAEMRGMLESTQGVVGGMAANDFKSIQESAVASGKRPPTAACKVLHQRLPEAWLSMGPMAHGGFDEIARLAGDEAQTSEIASELENTLREAVTPPFASPKESKGESGSFVVSQYENEVYYAAQIETKSLGALLRGDLGHGGISNGERRHQIRRLSRSCHRSDPDSAQ